MALPAARGAAGPDLPASDRPASGRAAEPLGLDRQAPRPGPEAAATRARLALLVAYRAEGSRRWIGASGGSMAPLIRPGDELDVRFGSSLPGPGRIVLFAREGLLVAHRVLAVEPHGPATALLTKGDAVARGLEHVTAAELLGVVMAIRPAGGRSSRLGCTGRSAVLAARLALAAERLQPARRSRRAWPLKLMSQAASGLARAALRSWTWCLVTTRRVESMGKGGEST